MPLRSDMTRVHATAVASKPRSMHALKRALLVLFVGLLLTSSVTWWRHSVDEQIASDRLQERGQLLTFETRDLLDRVGMHLTATAGLFQASEHVTNAEFHVFADDVGLMPGLEGIGYVQIVADSQLEDWLVQARARVPGLALREVDDAGNVIPLARRDLRFPVLYYESARSDSDAVVGLDIGSDVLHTRDLLTNLATLPIAMTVHPGDLTHHFGDQDYLIMAKAIGVPGARRVSEFVIGVVNLSNLMTGNTAAEVTDGLAWSTTDITTDAAAALDSPDSSDLWSGTVGFGGRLLRFTVAADSPEHPWLSTMALLTLFAGIAISLLLGVIVYLMLRRLEARGEMEVLESINEGKDDFLAAVSHRLRTPLTAVVGFSEVLRESDDGLSDADRRELVSTIAVQAIELGHLFDNLLTVTRDSGRSPFISAHVPLAQETYAVLDTADPERRVKTRVTSADRDVVAAGDSALVRQILRNLLSNATDFGERVEISVAGSGLMARVTVRDNGPGVPRDREKDIFALYESRGQVGQPDSMGVGLYVSRRLARRMSGDLTYRRENGWTVFELTLPAVPAAIDTRQAQEPVGSRN